MKLFQRESQVSNILNVRILWEQKDCFSTKG